MPFLSVQEVSLHQFTTLQSIFLSSNRNLLAASFSQGCSKNLAYLLASKEEDFPEESHRNPFPEEPPEYLRRSLRRKSLQGKSLRKNLSLPSILQINPIHLREPSASREEILPQVFHHQVDGAHGIPHADIAAAAVLPRVEREAGVVVVMKGAERLVPLHLHPHLSATLSIGRSRSF